MNPKIFFVVPALILQFSKTSLGINLNKLHRILFLNIRYLISLNSFFHKTLSNMDIHNQCRECFIIFTFLLQANLLSYKFSTSVSRGGFNVTDKSIFPIKHFLCIRIPRRYLFQFHPIVSLKITTPRIKIRIQKFYLNKNNFPSEIDYMCECVCVCV